WFSIPQEFAAFIFFCIIKRHINSIFLLISQGILQFFLYLTSLIITKIIKISMGFFWCPIIEKPLSISALFNIFVPTQISMQLFVLKPIIRSIGLCWFRPQFVIS